MPTNLRGGGVRGGGGQASQLDASCGTLRPRHQHQHHHHLRTPNTHPHPHRTRGAASQTRRNRCGRCRCGHAGASWPGQGWGAVVGVHAWLTVPLVAVCGWVPACSARPCPCQWLRPPPTCTVLSEKLRPPVAQGVGAAGRHDGVGLCPPASWHARAAADLRRRVAEGSACSPSVGAPVLRALPPACSASTHAAPAPTDLAPAPFAAPSHPACRCGWSRFC